MEEQKFDWKGFLLKIASYILVAAVASFATRFMLSRYSLGGGYSKLEELKAVITQRHIGETDTTQLEDAAASAMVAATGDRWSYYIPASQLAQVKAQKANAYVGIGITITVLENDQGFEVKLIEPNSPAMEGGIQPGDIVVAVDGKRVSDIGSETAKNMVSGEENTQVTVTVSRDGQELDITMTRRKIVQEVASGYMIGENVGYIHIANFNERCAQETIKLFDELESQGAKAMIFDVRFNGGGYKDEMVEVLDYLLPEGVLFRSEDYTGRTSEDRSDSDCKQMPMCVLINGESYSAAEFFAAALKEYDYAVTVGQPTTGKGYFQNTLELSDGSAVNLSVGKYYTPKGISLAEEGGLVPDITVEVDEETMVQLYSQSLPQEDDVQLQTAVQTMLDAISE